MPGLAHTNQAGRIRFPDRAAAGRALAPRLLELTSPPTIVLGVPRGGVPVAAPIAELLASPLAAVWVQKIVSPREPDVVIGAVDLDGDVTMGMEIASAEGLSDEDVAELGFHAHQHLLEEWERSPGIDATALLGGATAIVVDDCLNTGLTHRAAMRWARRQGARRVALAIPVVDDRIWAHLAAEADLAVALAHTDDVIARSDVYVDYRRVSDQAMYALLAEADRSGSAVSPR